MNFILDEKSVTPAYLQLYRHIVDDIVSDVYPYGSKLPSKRTIAGDTGLSLITVEHAISLLYDEGYIESRQRSGYFVIYRKDDFPGGGMLPPPSSSASKPSSMGKATPDLHGQTMLIPYSVAAKTMRRVILDYNERILVKSPNHGCDELRYEICAYLARSRGIHVDADQIIIGSGAEYLYGLIVQLLGTEAVYGIEDPSYEKIEKVYALMGAGIERLKMGRDGIESKALSESKATILHVTPFHSYPSGVTAGISKKHEYLRWANDRNAILIEDNYDSELTVSTKPEEPLFSMATGGNVIYLNTFSKTIAPSIRIGYMILPKEMVATFDEKLGFYSCTVPMFDQYVLAELIRSGDFERHINRVRRMKRRKEKEA